MSILADELMAVRDSLDPSNPYRLVIDEAIIRLNRQQDRIAELEARDSKGRIDKACVALIELGFSTGHGDTWEDIAWECIGNLEVCRAALQEQSE